MSWVLVVGAAWMAFAFLIAVVIGRSVRLADMKAAADAAADEPNFVVDPATSPAGFPAAAVLPFPAPRANDAHTPLSPPVGRDTPTVPGIPVARPQVPGAGQSGAQIDPIRKTGLG